MADLQYTVFEGASVVAQGAVLTENVVSIGGTTTQSSNVIDPTGSNRIRYVRLAADADCWVTWGANPTALNDGTGGRRIGAENPEYFWMLANQKIAVIERV